MINIISTTELESYIIELYSKAELIAKRKEIFEPLRIYFREPEPINFEGDFCFSRDNYFFWKH